MHKIKYAMTLTIVLALSGLATVAQGQAQTQWPRGDRNDNRQAGQIVARIDQRAARFQNTVERAVTQTRMDNTRREGKINEFVTDFRQAIAQLRTNLNSRQATDADVQMVLDRAARIDAFLRAHPGLTGVDNDWSMLRSDLDSLASAYNIAWNWDTVRDTADDRFGRGGSTAAGRLSGTFQLNASQSDDARSVVERAVRNLPYSDRQRASDMLLRRMEAPEMLSIDRQGRTITLASSRAPQMTFDADGREQVEQLPNSQRTMRVTANLVGDQLMITTTGNRDTDFTVTFDPINNGRQLRVTRRLSSDRLNQPVVVQSTYDQVSPTARWDLYNGSPAYGNNSNANDRYPNDRGGNYNSASDFFVPDGALIVGRLNDDLDTTRAHAGDRFTLTVISPPEYRDATIEGHVVDVNRSGRVTGRADLALAFDSIRMRDGRTGRFEGTLDSVRAANGENVRVDAEGTVKDNSSQTNRTVTRTAIGSAIGAVIGAVAGGGKGAAVGAVVGGGAGAGSVFVQGRNDLQLRNGTEITIRASAPGRRAMR
jgi:outer membrane lipoprotein SlyB